MSTVWGSVALTLPVQVLVSLVVFTPPVLAPTAAAGVGVDPAAVGLITAMIYLSAAFGALLSGGVIARYGPMRVSQLSLLACAAGVALMASGHLGPIVLGALVTGIGYGPVTPSSSAILAERTPPRLRALIFSIKQTGVPVGGAIAGALVPALALIFGWRGAALAVGGMTAALALLVQPWRGPIDRVSRVADTVAVPGLIGPLRLVLSQPRLRRIGFASFAFSGMQMCLGTYLVVYLNRQAGFSVAAAGGVLATAMAAGVAARILWGAVADHWVRPRALLGALGVAMSLAAFCAAGVTAAWPTTLVLLLSVVYGGTAIGWNGVLLAEVARLAPAGQAAAATGGTLALTFLGAVALPALFWFVVWLTGSYAPAFVAAGCLTLWRASVLLRAQ
jgi:MFS family permease